MLGECRIGQTNSLEGSDSLILIMRHFLTLCRTNVFDWNPFWKVKVLTNFFVPIQPRSVPLKPFKIKRGFFLENNDISDLCIYSICPSTTLNAISNHFITSRRRLKVILHYKMLSDTQAVMMKSKLKLKVQYIFTIRNKRIDIWKTSKPRSHIVPG